MPVMVAAALEMRAGSSSGEQRGNKRRTAVGTAGAARRLLRAASKQLESDNETGSKTVWLSLQKHKLFFKEMELRQTGSYNTS